MERRLAQQGLMAAAVAVAGALGACGGSDDAKPAPAASDDQRAILATIDALQTASRNDDAGRICNELFAPSLAKSIQRASKRGCEAEVRKTLTSPDAQLSVARKIDIKGSHATATIREQNGNASTVGFVKDGRRWRIERVTPVKRQ
jgi:hypothetical protein